MNNIKHIKLTRLHSLIKKNPGLQVVVYPTHFLAELGQIGLIRLQDW